EGRAAGSVRSGADHQGGPPDDGSGPGHPAADPGSLGPARGLHAL
ncbi:MAG: hypothetical protein AVDCRST_MAG68-4469, partial [uncultured Gemmatimonadetes bacterium]